MAQLAQDSIRVAIAPEYNDVGKGHRFFLGDNYRDLWAMPVKVRVLDLKKERGGLKIVKLGGGNQTRSIRFEDPKGKEWVLRTVQKYPERGLPENLRPTIAKKIVQDQVSTGHPFSALIVPSLAAKLQIPHANPEIVYVADDPGLMEYRKDFANAVYLFEEREPLETEETDNTEKVQRKLQEDNDDIVNQQLVLRARLLDFIIGDWDRHEDNWRWIPQKSKDGKVYQPIPRDRDKVFYKTAGVFPWILSHQWLKSNLQPFGAEIRDVKGWNYNARFFDRYFLNGLSEADWRKEIRLVQQTLKEEDFREALSRMPKEINALSGAELLSAMISRTRNLDQTAMEYYFFLAQTVEIPLSDKREHFVMQYLPDGQAELHIINIKKDGSSGRLLYKRKFDDRYTKEVRVYGFGGDDRYEVKGSAHHKMTVRMIGGEGADHFMIAPEVTNQQRLYIYDRLAEANQVPVKGEAHLKLSNDTTVNQYNKRSFMFDRLGPQFSASYSLDQGLQVGAGIIYEKQGFRKTPYAVKHEFWAYYTTGRESFRLDYEGSFKEVVGKYDVKIDANVLGPHHLGNFFGLGNNTLFIDHDDEAGMPYYRNRFDLVQANFKLARALAPRLQAEAGLATSFYTSKSSANQGRFLNDFNAAHPEEQVFADRFYLGLMANVAYDTRDQGLMPSKGIYWETGLSYQKEVTGIHADFARLSTEFRFYIKPLSQELVLANRIGAGFVLGAPAYFQQLQLGGVRNLRGFHTNRFTGRSMVYHNLDLRLKLFSFTSYIVPGSVGLIAFNDLGRVWVPNEHSKTWHHGYGGGLYIVPAELLLIQGAVGFSKEGALPYISIGFNF